MTPEHINSPGQSLCRRCMVGALACLVAILPSGCLTLPSQGPKVVEKNYVNYNMAVGDVLRSEMLLNLVRRRYFESPQFFAFGSISTSRGTNFGTSAGANWGRNSGNNSNNSSETTSGVVSGMVDAMGNVVDAALGRSQTNVDDPIKFQGVNAGASFGVSDSPSFTIVPQQGPEISNRLHMQIPPNIFAQMTNAGYSTDLIFSLLAQNVAGVRGVDVGTGVDFRKGSRDYMEMLNAMEALEKENELEVSNTLVEERYFDYPFAVDVIDPETVMAVVGTGSRYRSSDGGESYHLTSREEAPVMWIDSKSRSNGAGERLINIMGVDPFPEKGVWPLRVVEYLEVNDSMGESSTAGDAIRIRTRSFYGVLNLLSFGVDVPEGDNGTVAFSAAEYNHAVEQGLAPNIRKHFTVRFSKHHPGSAFVAAKYRGGWYYIDDRDRESKRVFNLLYDLYNLQVAPGASGAGQGAPVLTLPVG